MSIEALGRGLGDARFGGRGGIVGGGEGDEEVGVGPEFIVVVHGGMLVAEELEWKVVGSWMWRKAEDAYSLMTGRIVRLVVGLLSRRHY